MTTEERLKIIAAAVDGMTLREWWGVVDAIETKYTESKVQIKLENDERLNELLMAKKPEDRDDGRIRKFRVALSPYWSEHEV